MKSKLTESQREALAWLIERGGDGVFAGGHSRCHSLLAEGDVAPFMRRTWNLLRDDGLVEFYGLRRVRVTDAGRVAA